MSQLLECLEPDLHVHRLTDIDVARLKERGFEAVLLDLDNTLLPWKNSVAPPSSIEWVEAAKELGMKLAIVSNTHYPKRLNKIAGELGIIAVPRALKPRRRGFQEAAKLLECAVLESVVVGDQLFTDILGGNLAGAYTVLVDPMDSREFIGTKISRCLEWVAFRLLRLPVPKGTKSDSTKSEQEDTK